MSKLMANVVQFFLLNRLRLKKGGSATLKIVGSWTEAEEEVGNSQSHSIIAPTMFSYFSYLCLALAIAT